MSIILGILRSMLLCVHILSLNSHLFTKFRRLEKERADLIILRNQMSQDLERLLGYAEVCVSHRCVKVHNAMHSPHTYACYLRIGGSDAQAVVAALTEQ